MAGEELFHGGTLDMSAEPWPALTAGAAWTDVLTNRILACAAILLLLLNMLDLFRIAPHLIYSYDRSRGAADLEHNMGLARSRNLTALCYLLPLCLVADHFALARPRFFGGISPLWTAPATIGLILAFLLVRRLCYLLFRPARLSGEELSTLQHNIGNYIILLAVLTLTTVGLGAVFHLPDAVVRSILLWETAAVWLFNMVRSAQLLAARISGFSTFLYLCGLELIPAALLVTVVVLF